MAEPRHLILPDGIVSTAWPAVRDTCAQVGIIYDPWQQELNRALAAKDAEGLKAAGIAVISICRQAGKTFDVGGYVFAECIINPGTTVVWTAHRFKVARETFGELQSLAKLPGMAPHVDAEAITTAAGNECIPFRNGSRIVFAARERGSIRGFTKVRILVLDEGQILTESAMSDLAFTQNQAWNPQTIIMGTPPKEGDPSEVFTGLRDGALAGDGDVLYVEYGADPDRVALLDTSTRASIMADEALFWELVAEANPSYPLRTGKRAIRRVLKLVGPAAFVLEGLGVWDESQTSTLIDVDQWAALEDVEEEERPNPVALAIAAPRNRRWTTVALVGLRSDGLEHLQVLNTFRGTSGVVDEVARLKAKWKPVAVAIGADDAAASLVPDLKRARVKVTTVTARDEAKAAGLLVDGITAGTVRHGGGAALSIAVGAARKKKAGGAYVFTGPADESVDIAPLRATALALYALRTTKKGRTPEGGRGRRVVVLG